MLVPPRFAAASSFFALLVLATGARAQLLAHDGFGSGPRPDLAGSTAGSGWTAPWSSAGTDPTSIDGVGLDYPGLDTTHGGAVTAPATGVWPQSRYQRPFQAPPAGTNALYVSFLLRADAGNSGWGGLSFGQYPYAMAVGVPGGMYAFGLMTSHGLGDVSNRPLVLGQTVLVVVKISRNAPAPGIVYRMYLDPTVGSPEPANAAATYGMAPVSALPTYLSIDNGTGFTTDELRVGTTWAAVLPAQPPAWSDLGFAKPGANGAPHLAGVGSLSAHTQCGLTLGNACPSSVALLVLGSQVVNAPFLGGVLVPDVGAVVPMATDGFGAASLSATWPAGIPAGLPLRFQYWIADPAATFGFAASNGLQGVTR